MSRSAYVYDSVTGRIKYTIDEVDDFQIENLNAKGIPIFVSTPKYKIVGTYVKKNANTGSPMTIAPIERMDFISCNKTILVADGTDEAVISGLRDGMRVSLENENFSYIVDSDKTGSTFEISANGVSDQSLEHNQMIVNLSGYGCHDSKIKIKLIKG